MTRPLPFSGFETALSVSTRNRPDVGTCASRSVSHDIETAEAVRNRVECDVLDGRAHDIPVGARAEGDSPPIRDDESDPSGVRRALRLEVVHDAIVDLLRLGTAARQVVGAAHVQQRLRLEPTRRVSIA